MGKITFPSITSVIPIDLRRFLDRVRESIESLSDSAKSTATTESIPSLLVGSFRIDSSIAGVDYTAANVSVTETDNRVRVLISADSSAVFTIKHNTDTFTLSVASQDSGEITINGNPGIRESFTVSSDTPVGFTAFVFVASR